MKPIESKYRTHCHEWLKFNPECITLLDSVASHLNDSSRANLYKAVADYDICGGYPADDGDYDPVITALATDIILYIQYCNHQRSEESTIKGFTSPIFYEILAMQQPDFLNGANWHDFPPYSNKIKNIHLNRRTK